MHARPIARTIAGLGLVAAVVGPLSAGTAAAAPPMVAAFDVEFIDGSCGPELDAVVSLHVRFTDKLLPDGSLHHWLDLSGTIANDSAGKVVSLHATRRFTDSADGQSSNFSGLQSQFSAPGVGVLTHISGWSDDMLTRGRWDMTPTDELPPPVCDYLFG